MIRQAKQRGVAVGATGKAMAGGLQVGIGLGFSHHEPQQAAVVLVFNQEAAAEFRTHAGRAKKLEETARPRPEAAKLVLNPFDARAHNPGPAADSLGHHVQRIDGLFGMSGGYYDTDTYEGNGTAH